MRVLVQRVKRASVRVDGTTTGEIGPGLLLFVGIGQDDDGTLGRKLAGKVGRLRIFGDEHGKMNRSVTDVGGALLAVSQFTLYGDPSSGNRPSYAKAARPEVAQPLFEEFVAALRSTGVQVETGRFGAQMQVELVNDGPVTLWLDTEDL